MEPAARLIGVRTTVAADIAPLVALAPNDPLLELQRVFTANGKPVAFDTAYFPLPEFEWLRHEDLEASWYEHLAARGITLSHARTTVDAKRASEHVAALLEVDEGEALLCLQRLTYARGDSAHGQRPLAFTNGLFRTDRYQFSFMLSRR
jgi:GntR family transcriptional regulator